MRYNLLKGEFVVLMVGLVQKGKSVELMSNTTNMEFVMLVAHQKDGLACILC